MTKFNMMERHRKRHCNNDKGDDPEIKIEMKKFREESKKTQRQTIPRKYLLIT